MPTHPETARLLEPLLAAVEDDSNWAGFLAELTKRFRAEVAILFLHDYRCASVPYFISHGVDEAMKAEYIGRLGAVNPWVAEQEPMSEGSVVLSHHLASDASIPRSEYYADFLRPLGIRHAVGSNILKSDGRAVKLGVLRSARRGPMGERDLDLVRGLMPSLQSVLRMRSRLEMLESRNRMNWTAIEALSVGVIFLDRWGAVRCMNAAARETCEAADGLFVDERGHLCAGVESDRKWLRTTIDRVRQAASCTTVGALRRRSGGQPLSIRIEPIVGTMVSKAVAAELVLFICEPDRAPRDLEATLLALWRLTPAEARLAACLVRGLSLKEAAEQLEISEGTARFFSKQVFAKTSTRGQTEFVRVAINSVAGATGRRSILDGGQ